MRCRACDCALTDKESTRKNPVTHEYEDMCEACLGFDEFDDEELKVIEELIDEIFGDDA